MHNSFRLTLLCVLGVLSASLVQAETCVESRASISPQTNTINAETSAPNLRCSDTTNALLWWHDPFADTIPMPAMPAPWSIAENNAVIRPVSRSLVLYPVCGVACHNGAYPPIPESVLPRPLTMHVDIIPDAMNLQHGNGSIWCLDCHHKTKRKSLVDNFGGELHMDATPALCGNCHGQVYADWRDGLHGKRIGDWAESGQKRWFTCSECHNPHDVINGLQGSGFKALRPEPAPSLPRGMKSNVHELPDGSMSNASDD